MGYHWLCSVYSCAYGAQSNLDDLSSHTKPMILGLQINFCTFHTDLLLHWNLLLVQVKRGENLLNPPQSLSCPYVSWMGPIWWYHIFKASPHTVDRISRAPNLFENILTFLLLQWVLHVDSYKKIEGMSHEMFFLNFSLDLNDYFMHVRWRFSEFLKCLSLWYLRVNFYGCFFEIGL